MEARKKLWRGVQLYTRSIGLVIKKLPVSLLKKADMFDEDASSLQGNSSLKAVRKYRKLRFHDQLRDNLKQFAGAGLSAAQAEILANYVEDVFSNFQFSKSFNLYVAFSIDRRGHHGGALTVIGLVGTGTFNPHRYEELEDGTTRHFSLRPVGIASNTKAAEIELLVAQSGYGKALALWGLGDLLMRSSHGQARYTQVLTQAVTPRSRRLFESLGFEQVAAKEFVVGKRHPQAASEPVYALRSGAADLTAILKADRLGLYDLCPIGKGVKLWQRCR